MTQQHEGARASRRQFMAGLAAAGLAPGPALARNEPLRIGALVPLTGGLDNHGAQMRLGLETAVDGINGAGGVLGRQVELVYADSAGTPQGLAANCERLVREDRISAAVGPFIAAGRKTAAAAFGKLGVPVISASNNEGQFCGDTYFSLGPTPNQDILPLLDQLDGGEGRSYFLVGTYSSWQLSSFRQAALKIIYGLGGAVTGQALTPIGEVRFSPILRWIRSTGADAVVLCVPRLSGVHFVHNARALGLINRVRLGWVGFNELHAQELPQNEVSQVTTMAPFAASDRTRGVPELVARMAHLTGAGIQPTYYAYTHHAALSAIAAAAEASGETSPAAILAGLKGLTFETATGPVTIDAQNHHARLNIVVARGNEGGLDIVQRLGAVDPEPGCGA